MSTYATLINRELDARDRLDADPRHVEAYIRLEHSTLDALSPYQLQTEVGIALHCLQLDGLDHAERLAQSFGL